MKRKKWLHVIDRPDLRASRTKPTSHRVCSLHFEKSMIVIIPKLKDDAVPTKSLPGQPSTSNANTNEGCNDASTQTEKSLINNLSAATIKGPDKNSSSVQTTSENISDTTQTSLALSSDTPRKRKLRSEIKDSNQKRRKLANDLNEIRKEVQSKESESNHHFSFKCEDEVNISIDYPKELKMSPESKTSKNKDKIRKHTCTICQKGFTRKGHLDRHWLSHSGEKPHWCTTCNKQFRHKHNLNTHMLLHSKVKPYECPMCLKQFTEKRHLNEHFRNHSREKQFVCPTCSKTFSQKGPLNRHMFIHSGEKPHECPTCQKRFTRKEDLRRHLITHSGSYVHSNVISHTCNSCRNEVYGKYDKHYSCEICNKGFAQKYKLIRHLRVHSGEKPYSCSTCKKVFAHKCNLKRHIKKHSLEEKSSPFEPKGYPGNVKKEVTDGLEPNKSDFCFKVPIIIQGLMSEGDLETQTLNVKQEPTENADPACLNLCDDLFVKEERELP